jgi:hypothetical protein
MTDIEKAEKLEHSIELLQRYVRVLRDEEIDYTGLGLWQIFCNSLIAVDCKVITKSQYEWFKKRSDEEYAKAVAERDAAEKEKRNKA